MNNIAAPTYGIAEISIPSMRSKRESNVTQRFSIMFSDGKAKYVNLIRKDGILANIDTPVWYAAGVPNSDRVVYASSTVRMSHITWWMHKKWRDNR